jgi:hypothetical protein
MSFRVAAISGDRRVIFGGWVLGMRLGRRSLECEGERLEDGASRVYLLSNLRAPSNCANSSNASSILYYLRRSTQWLHFDLALDLWLKLRRTAEF